MKHFFVATLTATALFGAVVAVPIAAPATAMAATCDTKLLGIIPPWYRGLTDSSCHIKQPANIAQFITKVALNILQAALVVVGLVTVFFIIKGGIAYMTSMGTPDGMATARKTITNAIIGLIISMLSAIIVNYLVGIL